jgi:hypothetical protein
MANRFGVGAVGQRITVVNEIPERLSAEQALNLAAHLAACALSLKGDPGPALEKLLEEIADAAGDGAVADRVRAELKG